MAAKNKNKYALTTLRNEARNLEIGVANHQQVMDEALRRFLDAHMLQVRDQDALSEIQTSITEMEKAAISAKVLNSLLDPPDLHAVDRVAMAIWQADRAAWETPKHWEWEEITPQARDRCRRMARAALAAMGKETA
jgi:hypothetical protein